MTMQELEGIFQMTDNEDIVEMISRKRLKYFGHIARYPAERWVRQLVAGEAIEKKSIGRPAHTWYNATINDMKSRGASIKNVLNIGVWRKITSIGQPKKPQKGNIPKRQSEEKYEQSKK